VKLFAVEVDEALVGGVALSLLPSKELLSDSE